MKEGMKRRFVRTIIVLGFFIAGCEASAFCNNANGDSFLITDSSISGSNVACVGMTTIYTCNIETDPSGHEGDLSVEWDGPNQLGAITFQSEGVIMIEAKVTGSSDGSGICENTPDPMAVAVYSLDSFKINLPYSCETFYAPGELSAMASAYLANIETFPVNVTWTCAGASVDPSTGWTATLNKTEASHNCNVIIDATGIRYTDVECRTVSVKTFNSSLKVSFDELEAEIDSLTDQIIELAGQIADIDIELGPAETDLQTAREAQEAALQSVMEWDESVESIVEVVNTVASGFTAMAVCTAGAAGGWTVGGVLIYSTRVAAESAATSFAIDLGGDIAAELSDENQNLEACNNAYEVASQLAESLKLLKDAKEDAKTFLELERDRLIGEQSELNVCP